MQTSDFDFELPLELIAQRPASKRDESRLLVVQRDSRRVAHRSFRDLVEYLHPGDVLVLNDSLVIPARLRGRNATTGGQFELLLLEENATNDWWAMLRPGKRARPGTQILLQDHAGRLTTIGSQVIEVNAEGHRRLQFTGTEDILEAAGALGEVPLPPYINRAHGERQQEEDRARYQTVYAKPAGSVAAPTAGLHFTEALLEEIRSRGVRVCFVTLHVGLGTFAPVKAERIDAHIMHEERYEISEDTARVIKEAKREGRRVIAVGTTTLRVLESVAKEKGLRSNEVPEGKNSLLSPALSSPGGEGEPHATGRGLEQSGASLFPAGPTKGRTRIFIYPPYEFKVVDVLLTNFHLPRSTLLMLISAFAAPRATRGRELILAAYAEAVRERYRFFSYGDAMLLL